jgi:hypothetical protein
MSQQATRPKTASRERARRQNNTFAQRWRLVTVHFVAPADGATVGFRAWGKANGFIRKGTTLRRDQAETIAVVNLQGSQWGRPLLRQRGAMAQGFGRR